MLCDPADFFVCCLQENERTLAILTLRIKESFPNEVGLINDLNELHSIVNKLSRDFVRTVEECECDTPPLPPCSWHNGRSRCRSDSPASTRLSWNLK